MPNSPNPHPDSPASTSGPGFSKSSGPLGHKTGTDPWNSARGPVGRDSPAGEDQEKASPLTLAQFMGPRRPAALSDWEDRVDNWCDRYCATFDGAELSEINMGFAVYIFDHNSKRERVVLAYAVSVKPLMERDKKRIDAFLRGKKTEETFRESVQRVLNDNTFSADRGHFLGHASGGILDINLFPHRSELNEGHSEEGKLFRKMECYVEEHPGTFFYHRPIYDDESWIPQLLQYGVLKGGTDWWEEQFSNKTPRQPTINTNGHVLQDPDKYVEKSFVNGGGHAECVEFIKQALGAPATTSWREGKKITKGDLTLPRGTAIATFVNGKYPQNDTGQHAAVYLGQDGFGIQVLDQWRKKPTVTKRTIKWKNGIGLSNQAGAFSVIEW